MQWAQFACSINGNLQRDSQNQGVHGFTTVHEFAWCYSLKSLQEWMALGWNAPLNTVQVRGFTALWISLLLDLHKSSELSCVYSTLCKIICVTVVTKFKLQVGSEETPSQSLLRQLHCRPISGCSDRWLKVARIPSCVVYFAWNTRNCTLNRALRQVWIQPFSLSRQFQDLSSGLNVSISGVQLVLNT